MRKSSTLHGGALSRATRARRGASIRSACSVGTPGGAASEVCRGVPNDPLVARAALYARARALATGENTVVTQVGGAAVEGFEFNSATHRYRINLRVADLARNEEVDHVIVHAGFG